MKKVSRLKKNNSLNKISRLRRIITSEWNQVDMSDPNLMQILTDSMTYGYSVQIDYENSGWRTIQPYGWNTSKDGNVLLMCYKDSGEVRSYRLDKIKELYIDEDSSLGMSFNDNPSMENDRDLDVFDSMSNNSSEIDEYVNLDEIDMPPIPGQENNHIENDNIGEFEEELLILNPDNAVQDNNFETNNFETNDFETNDFELDQSNNQENHLQENIDVEEYDNNETSEQYTEEHMEEENNQEEFNMKEDDENE